VIHRFSEEHDEIIPASYSWIAARHTRAERVISKPNCPEGRYQDDCDICGCTIEYWLGKPYCDYCAAELAPGPRAVRAKVEQYEKDVELIKLGGIPPLMSEVVKDIKILAGDGKSLGYITRCFNGELNQAHILEVAQFYDIEVLRDPPSRATRRLEEKELREERKNLCEEWLRKQQRLEPKLRKRNYKVRATDMVKIDGEMKTIRKWFEVLNPSVSLFHAMSRIQRGWDYKEAITTPAHGRPA